MKTYETIEVKYWQDHQVYYYNFTTGEEQILDNTYTIQIVNEFNKKGYFVSATHIQHGKVVYIMTKEIEGDE
jgi:hypothetical protein